MEYLLYKYHDGPQILKIHQELILPFRVTMDGNDLYWAELQAIKDYRVLGLYLAAKMPCCKSMETQGAVTKAFPANQ
jgi:hypothetical protein